MAASKVAKATKQANDATALREVSPGLDDLVCFDVCQDLGCGLTWLIDESTSLFNHQREGGKIGSTWLSKDPQGAWKFY